MTSIKALASSPSFEGGKNAIFGSARKKSHDFFTSMFNSSSEAPPRDGAEINAPSAESHPTPKSSHTGRFFTSMLPAKSGLFSELSVKLEAAINNFSHDAPDSDTSSNVGESTARSTEGDANGSRSIQDVNEVERPDAFQSSLSYKKKTACWKDRSVYGQPEIWSLSTKGKVSSEVSLDSLDTLDSDLQSLGNRSSISGGRDSFSNHRHSDPFFVFRRHSDSAAVVSESLPPSTSLDSSDNESLPDRGYLGRSVSGGSWTSSLSYDSQPEDSSSDTVEFIKKFVEKIFINSPLSFEEKARFGEVTRQDLGRLWFARIINAQRVFNKQVSETTFYSLVQFFAIVLFECAEADDFSPAKTLMNMCFTFYQMCGDHKEYLYLYLKEQPIWRSMRFWEAAFFDAVQCERSHRSLPTRDLSPEQVSDEQTFQENVMFGQLGTFTHNMYQFGLPKKFCYEFLCKQATIANLSQDHLDLLKDNIERLYKTRR